MFCSALRQQYCLIIFWHWTLLYENPIPPLLLIEVFWFWLFCLDVQMMIYPPVSISKIRYVSQLRMMHSISQENDIIFQYKNSAVFFRENFLLSYLCIYLLFRLWSWYIKMRVSQHEIIFAWPLSIQACPNYFRLFAFLPYNHYSYLKSPTRGELGS